MVQALKCLIYAFISGLSEIVPASARGHQSVMMLLFGMSQRDPMLDLMTHLGIMSCIIVVYKAQFSFLYSKGRVAQSSSALNRYDRRLLFSAMIPMLIGLMFYNTGSKYELNPLSISLFFLLNAVLLIIPDYIRQSNKSAKLMGPFDSLLIGLSGLLAVFPGFSRLGSGCAAAVIRGADKQQAFNWLVLLTVPAMAMLIVIDIIGLFSVGIPGISLWLLFGYIIAAAASFGGCYIGIILMRFLMVNSGFSSFAFYSFGASFFTFIVYLIAF